MRLIDVLGPGTVVAVIVTVMVLGVRKAKARMKVLENFAARMGMSYRIGPQGAEVEGTVRGVPLRIGYVSRAAWNGRGHRSPLRFTGRPQRPLPTVIVRHRHAPSDMLPGLAEVRLGDPAFDNKFSLNTADEAAARSLLDPALVAELVGNGNLTDWAEAMKIDANEVYIEFDGESGTHHEPQRLERIVNLVANLCAPLPLR
jgi:hypothetical protein